MPEPQTIVDARLDRLEKAVLFLLRDHQRICERRVELNKTCNILSPSIKANAIAELSEVNDLIAAMEKR